MCMLSALLNYPAAEQKLRNMIAKQEALFGGYYSGIGLVSEDKLQLTKTKGAVCDLAELRSGACSGIAHSRTKSGGDSSRAQPYRDHFGLMLGMGTGTHGIFAQSKAAARQALADELCAEGVEFSSKDDELAGSAKLPCGASVHNTELIVQAVAHRVKNGLDHIGAIQEVCSKAPAEGGYVFLFANKPYELFIANFNMRFLVSETAGSVLVASSHMALSDEESVNAEEVPLNSILRVRQGLKDESVLSPELETSLNRNSPGQDKIEGAVLSYLAEVPNSPWPTIVEKAVLPLFQTTAANTLMPCAFQATERLLAEKKILSSTRQLSDLERRTIPELIFSIN